MQRAGNGDGRGMGTCVDKQGVSQVLYTNQSLSPSNIPDALITKAALAV